MERKHFNCYACNKNNNFYVQNNKIGNCCKYCGTFNYFKIKTNNKNYNINNRSLGLTLEEIPLNTSLNSINNSINNNIYSNCLDESSPLLSNNFQNNNNFNNYNNFQQPINYSDFFQDDNLSNNYESNSIKQKKDEQFNDIHLNKYGWLKKTKATKDIIEKHGKDLICPICYEKYREKDFIHITKCKHIFHYLCIEKTIDNNIYDCPLCRSNIKTGEKKNIDERNNSNYNIENNNEYILVNMYFIDNNDENNNNLFISENNGIFIKNIFFWVFKIFILILGLTIIFKRIKSWLIIILIVIILMKLSFLPKKIKFIIFFFFIITFLVIILNTYF